MSMFENVRMVNGRYRQVGPDSGIEGQERELIRDAISDTNQEIFDSVFDNAPDDNDGFDEFEQVEGWDGDPLSDDELIEGVDENGYDRPLQLAADEALIEQRQKDSAEIAQLRQQIDELQNGSERQEQFRQQARELLYNKFGVLGTDDRIDSLANQLASQQGTVQRMQTDRFNESMSRAHQEYGADFEHRFEAFNNLPQTPLNIAMAQEVWSAPDPGERLMALSNGLGGVHSMRGYNLPSLNTVSGGTSHRGTPRGGGSRGERGGRGRDDFVDAVDAQSGGIPGIEQDIFDSVFGTK